MGLKKYIQQGANIGAAQQNQREYRLFQAQLNKDLQRVLAMLKSIPVDAIPVEEQEAALRKAAVPLVLAAQAKAPEMKDRKIAHVTLNGLQYQYYPGNLKKSIQEINFKRRRRNKGGKAKSRLGGVIYIGPKVTRKRRPNQKFGADQRTVDAFYAAMVEFGTRNMRATPYMRPAYDSTKRAVISGAAREIKALITAWAAKKGVTWREPKR